MKTIQKIALLLFSMFIFVACDEDPIVVEPTPIGCLETSSEFQSLFQSLVSAGHTDEVNVDTEIHAYTFTLSADKKVCKIGYQSQPDVKLIPYVIEFVDNSTNTTIYSDSHTFSSDTTSYDKPTSTINLQAGISYTLKRIQTNWISVSNTIGRVAWRDTMDFPYTHDIMTITGSDFYQGGGPLPGWAVPYIDLILED